MVRAQLSVSTRKKETKPLDLERPIVWNQTKEGKIMQIRRYTVHGTQWEMPEVNLGFLTSLT